MRRMSAVTSLVQELKRRNIFKVVTAYAVAAFVILQLCDILFPAIGIEDAIITYVVIALIILLPPLVIFSWMFEVTPDGLKRTREVSHQDSITQSTGQRINNIIIVLLSVALAFFMYQYFQNQEGEQAATESEDIVETTPEPEVTAPVEVIDARPSVAVLPFVNMSSDQENEYFSDGLSEEVLNLLAQIQGLRVAGRTSSFFYKGKHENLTDIGKALNVDNILEGSVRKSGDKVRITAQLISAEDGFHLWSKSYDRTIDDIFAVQDEIAGEVTRAMQLTLLSDGINIVDRTTSNQEAYDLYLRAKNALYDRKLESIRLAINLYEQSMALDPEYGPPLLEYAAAHLIIYNNHSIGSHEEMTQKAYEALQKAENLGYTPSEYYSTLGLYYEHRAEVDIKFYPQAKENFEKAIELNENNVNAYMWLANLYSELSNDPDRYQKAEMLNLKAKKLDPLNRVANGNYAIQLALRDETAALQELGRLIRIDPEYDHYVGVRTNIYQTSYRHLESVESLKHIGRSHRFHPFNVIGLLWNFDDTDSIYEYLGSIPLDNPMIDFARMLEVALKATPEELVAEAEVILLKEDPDFYAGPLIYFLLEDQEYDLARRLIENARPDLATVAIDDVSIGVNGPHPAYLLSIYRLGQVERAKSYARELLELNKIQNHTGMYSKGVMDSLCYLVLNDKEAAVRDWQEAAAEGWLGYYNDPIPFETEPLFNDFLKDRRIQDIKQKIDAELAAQKPKVYAALAKQDIISI